MKTTKISIQQIKMNSLYNNTENINASINIKGSPPSGTGNLSRLCLSCLDPLVYITGI
jgi:hypothetical protein